MKVTTFAAIDVGSNEVSMKIFEITKKNNIRQLSHVRHVMELGSDTYVNGYISNKLINELCDILKGFSRVMKDFGVVDYRAYSTSSIREANNRHFLLDRIKVRAGIEVHILSNSEQRFLLYQALAIKEPLFNDLIEQGVLIVDVGSGSSQATCFSHGELEVSQNLRLGSIRINEFLGDLERSTESYTDLLTEYIEGDIYTSFKNYFNKYEIKSILATGEGLCNFQKYISLHKPDSDIMSAEEIQEIYNSIFTCSVTELAHMVNVSEEQARLILPTAMIYQQIMTINHAECIRFNSTDLCDGIAAEYAAANNIIEQTHSFKKDVLSAAKNIAARYFSNEEHTSYVEKLALSIFDSVRKISGLSIQDRLLLQVAITLHDCGAYINFQEVASNSYKIILSSEIIGLSNRDRMLIANIVKTPIEEFPSYDLLKDELSEEEYIKIAKLTSIFRIANDLDTSKKQKLTHIKTSFRVNKLTISGEAFMDLAIEKAYFSKSADFFEQTFGIKPNLKLRRTINV